ncbi:hypothetical protein [Miniphocaeibacter massiliensis]|uniref:hypothetical protein n=1 Tax=Miniphocaeibacter massiliensis TaxID=2041841 RepID=UPI000C1C006A|nr:hypothetical protein [Miniphocaeibacter massiliensis]
MEILEKTKFYVGKEEFNTQEEADNYMDIKARVDDLKRIAKSNMKERYMSLDDALEDAFITLIDRKDKTIDILERPF